MMKKYLLISVILFLFNEAIARPANTGMKGRQQEVSGRFNEIAAKQASIGIATVNTHDTVVFDLSHLLISGNHVDIPVLILSDDTINSLDFSLKFNQANLVFDSILNLTGYVQPFSFYNSMDSTLRFTSNSLQNYGLDTSLVSIRFTMLSGQISTADLNSLTAYLNGDVCSIKVTDFIPLTVGHISAKNPSIAVYPNPACGLLNIEVSENSTIQLVDVNGSPVSKEINLHERERYKMNTEHLAAGIYTLNIYGDNFISRKKILIYR